MMLHGFVLGGIVKLPGAYWGEAGHVDCVVVRVVPEDDAVQLKYKDNKTLVMIGTRAVVMYQEIAANEADVPIILESNQ